MFFDLEPYVSFQTFAHLALIVPCLILAWAYERNNKRK